jgi:hypothetical protein
MPREAGEKHPGERVSHVGRSCRKWWLPLMRVDEGDSSTKKAANNVNKRSLTLRDDELVNEKVGYTSNVRCQNA